MIANDKGVAVSYTTMPLKSFSKGDTHISFWELASATFPTYRNLGIGSKSAKTFPSANGTYLPPDEQLMCFDVLYYVAAKKPFEWAEDYSCVYLIASAFQRTHRDVDG